MNRLAEIVAKMDRIPTRCWKRPCPPAQRAERILDLDQIVVRDAGKEFDRFEREPRTRVGIVSGEEEEMLCRRELRVHSCAREGHFDQFPGEKRGVGTAKLFECKRRPEDEPIRRVAEIESEAVDRLACRHRNKPIGELNRAIDLLWIV